MIFAPAKYGEPRTFEGASGYLPLGGFARPARQAHVPRDRPHHLHRAIEVENGRSIPGSGSKLKDEFQTRMVLRREFALMRAKRTALWWFDFFGGYYYDGR